MSSPLRLLRRYRATSCYVAVWTAAVLLAELATRSALS